MNKTRFGLIYLSMVAAAALALGSFLFASAQYYRLGFPLDDAWIHQTYARNFAASGVWAYIPGIPSAGSTSPLWTLILSFGHLITANPYWPAFILGGLFLVGIGFIASKWFFSAKYSMKIWVGIGLWFIFEWHLVWSAGSGMETLLYAVMIAAFFAGLQNEKHYWISAILAGLAVWLRPDGITLLGPLFFVIVFGKRLTKETVRTSAASVFILSLFFGAYLYFNYSIAGSIWPNTYFAKQAEYAELLDQPFVSRFISLAALPFIGGGLLLIPGVLTKLISAIRCRDWLALAAFLWWVGYTGLYAFRLPVTYQHGRYLIPAMPILWILGWMGTLEVFSKLKLSLPMKRLGLAAGVSLIVLLQAGFFALGIDAYRNDTAIIESEMVDTAVWVANNTPPDALIAAHDIGALGYFGKRELVDLAGLISPEVIPFIRDEAKLEAYMQARGVEYLVTFPGWYPNMIRGKTLLYSSQAKFSPAAGGENMQVFFSRQP